MPDGDHTITVSTQPIAAFERANPTRTSFGRLRFLGGLNLTSTSPSFGGWSGLAIEADGKRFMAVSDQGAWMSGEISYEGVTPRAIHNAVIGPIKALSGRQLANKRERDAESIALLEGNLGRGTVLISFERLPRIGVFPVSGQRLAAPKHYLKLPIEARQMPPNRGLEAVTLLPGGPHKGAVVAFAEEFLTRDRHHTGWIWPSGPAGSPHPIYLIDRNNFAVTDLAALADGSLIVLERYFSWTQGVRIRLRLIPPQVIKPNAILNGATLLQADMTYEIDNMEGLAVHQDAGGRTILTLISDNNFNPLFQRTILLQFALQDQRL